MNHPKVKIITINIRDKKEYQIRIVRDSDIFVLSDYNEILEISKQQAISTLSKLMLEIQLKKLS